MTYDRKGITEPIAPSGLLTDFEHRNTPVRMLSTCLPFERDESKPVLVCITGPSGSGKDTVMAPLVADNMLRHVTTATSRKRRYKLKPDADPSIAEILAQCKTPEELNLGLEAFEKLGTFEELEPKNAYIWMRWRRPEETEKDYYTALVEEYHLVEFDIHYQGMYGLPQISLEPTQTSHAPPLLRVDINGIQHIRELLSNAFDIFALAFIPDTWEQVIESIRNRETNGHAEENIQARVQEDKASIGRYPGLINFVIQNHRGKVAGLDGRVYSSLLFKKLLLWHNVS